MRSFKTAFDPGFLAGYQRGVMTYTYRRRRCMKSPIDMAIYLWMISEIIPGTVIEIGTKEGGSAMLLRDYAQLFNPKAQVVTIDLTPPANYEERDIRALRGDVHDLDTVFSAENLFSLPRPWLVIEDSAHTKAACLAALAFFGQHLRRDEFLIMEDGILVEQNLRGNYAGGPNAAITEFMAAHPGIFRVEEICCDMFGVNATYSPNGYLRRL